MPAAPAPTMQMSACRTERSGTVRASSITIGGSPERRTRSARLGRAAQARRPARRAALPSAPTASHRPRPSDRRRSRLGCAGAATHEDRPRQGCRAGDAPASVSRTWASRRRRVPFLRTAARGKRWPTVAAAPRSPNSDRTISCSVATSPRCRRGDCNQASGRRQRGCDAGIADPIAIRRVIRLFIRMPCSVLQASQGSGPTHEGLSRIIVNLDIGCAEFLDAPPQFGRHHLAFGLLLAPCPCSDA